MTQEETKAALFQILRQMTNIASDLQTYADELTRLQMAAIGARRVKSRPQTTGNIVVLPGVCLDAARRAQQRSR